MTSVKFSTFIVILFLFGIKVVFGQTFDPDGSSPTSVNLSTATATFTYNLVEPTNGFQETVTYSNNNGSGDYTNYSLQIEPSTKKDVIFTFTSQLQYNTTYEITFTIAPESGGADETYTFSFDTGPAASVTPVTKTGICIDANSSYELDDIVIDEGTYDNFYSDTGKGQSLLLKVDSSFSFEKNSASIALQTSTDITSTTISYPTDSTIQIDYDLCTGASCSADTSEPDKITITGLKVSAKDRYMDPSVTYSITRSNVANTDASNDAVMPGIPNGTVFATLQVETGPPLTFSDENTNVIASGDTVKFCPESSIKLELDVDGGLQSGDVITYYGNGVALLEADFDVTDTSIKIDTASIKDGNTTDSDIKLPLHLYAELERTGVCLGYSPEITVDTLVVNRLSNLEIISDLEENGEYSPIDDFNIIDVSNVGGVLSISKNGTEVEVFENYNGGYKFNTMDFASETDNVDITISYVGISNSGCNIGSTSIRFTIYPIPKIEEEIGVLPSYCEDDAGLIDIFFKPINLTDSTEIDSLQVSGEGISGSMWTSYPDSLRSNDSTGYAFDLAAAIAALPDTSNSVNINLSYKSTVKKPIYEEECYIETYTVEVDVCDNIYGCKPCKPGFPCSVEPVSQQAINNECNCSFAETCVVIGQDCHTELQERTRTVCNTVIVDYEEYTNYINKNYSVQILSVPELGFRTVTRQPVDTVFCEDSGPIFLLGSPGTTFANKNFSLLNNDDQNITNLSDFSFTPGENGVIPNDKGYSLIFNFLGDISNCPNTDTLDFRIVPVPEAIQFDSSLALVDSIPTFSYCIGDAMDSVRLDSLAETKIVWRDDRGIALDTGYSFLPPLSTDQAKLQRFTAERYHIYGGCAGPASDFYIQVGHQPEAAYDFATTCGNSAGFKALASHNGTAARNDTINNYVWDFGDGSPTLNTNEDTVAYTFVNAGVYDVSMYVETSLGCSDSTAKKVSVFNQVSVGNEYHESFDNGSGGWIATSENDNDNGNAQNSSWTITNVLGQPAWATRNDSTGRFNNDEYSWVESPCFDMNQWQNPMIEMDVHYNVQSIEGAVLQYRVNDPAIANPQWKLLGDLDRGVNWYNNASITASPGGSIIGWSGQSDTTDWTRAAFNLSKVKSEANGNMVQFRVAFASLDQTSRLSNYEGFAFDNVTIREKDRNVVLEHFTNVTIPSLKAERDSVSEYAMNRNDIVYIQYHTEEGDDPFYYNDYFPKNTSNDHLARRYFYGLDGPGYSVVNGQLLDTADFNNGWVQQSYSSQSLSYAPFDINIAFTKQSDGQLNVQAEALRNAAPNALLDNWQGDLTLSLTVAIVQKEVNYEGETLHNVLVKYLPFQGGVVQSGTWAAGSGASLNLEDTWQVLKDAPANEYAAIAMVQLVHGVEENQYGYPMNEVYQAAEETIDIPLTKSAVTGVEDNLGEGIRVYPNPVNDQLHINMGANRDAVNWTFYNLQGEKVAQGEIEAGNRQAIISTALFRPGMYLLVLHNDNSQYQQRVTIMR